MKRMKKIVLASSLAVVMLAGAATAFARPGGPGGSGGFPGMFMMRLFGDLDLTEQQELQAIRARRAIKEQAQQAREESSVQIGQAIDELGKANPDSQKLHGLADQAIARFTKVAHSAIDQMLAIHATLSPEQKTTLHTRAKEMHERRMEKRERREQRDEKKPARR